MESTNTRFGAFGKRACTLLTVSALIMILWADIQLSGKLEGICVCTISGLCAVWCINLALRHSRNVIVCTVICIYVCFAFGLKIGLFTTTGAHAWLTDFDAIGTIAPDELMHAYIISAYGTISLICGLACATIFARRRSAFQAFSSAPTYRYTFLTLLVSYTILLLKPIMQDVFGIGISGATDNTIIIPNVAGIIALLIGPCGFAIVNVSLFVNVAAGKSKTAVLLSFVATILNVVLDLYGGYKSSLVLQAILFAIYGLHFSKGMRAQTRVFMYCLIVSCVAMLLLIYPYVNYYRYGIISGLSSVDAVSFARHSLASSETSGIGGIVSRINGIDNFFAATLLGGGNRFHLSALWSDDFNRAFLQFVYGRDDVNSGFGLTQFGALYLIGGAAWLVVGGFSLGVLIVTVTSLALKIVGAREGLVIACAPIFAAFWLKLLFASGGVILLSKEFLMTCLVLTTLVRLTQERSQASAPIARALTSRGDRASCARVVETR